MLRKSILTGIKNQYSKYQLGRNRKIEIDKIKNPEREKIYQSVLLSAQQKKEIDCFYITNLGEKIPYDWHREYTAFTGHFDYRYFPELLFVPEFEKYMNPLKEYNRVFEDKNVLPIIAKSVGVKMPKTVALARNGIMFCNDMLRVSMEDLLEYLDVNAGRILFVKPSLDSSSGNACQKLYLGNYSKDELKNLIIGYGRNFVIQECIDCSKDITALNSSSVNTFRIITYRWKNEMFHMPTIMRIGRGGSEVDNAHAGGMFIGVSDDGILAEKAFTEFREEFADHPDSHVIFRGYAIENFSKVLKAAYRMAWTMPEIGIVNWDFTIDKDGNPVLVEANIGGGSIWLTQMANGVGCFAENTGEILQWIKKMRRIPASEYSHYMCGK